jgi:hypothetical protein
VISKYVLSEVIERAISILPRKEGWRVAHQMGESETCAKLKDMGKYFKRFSPFKMKSVRRAPLASRTQLNELYR